MWKLLVLFGSLIAFIYALAGFENKEKESLHTKQIPLDANADPSVAYPAEMQLIAYNNRDINEFSKWFADDVKLYRLGANELFCDGKEQLENIYGKLFSEKINLNCRIAKRIVCGDYVIDEEYVSGLAESGTVHATAIYEVKDSKIARAWFIKGR